MSARRAALLALGVALALAACARSETSPDSAVAARESVAQQDRDEAAATDRREASFRAAGERARAAAKSDIARSDAREARRAKAFR